ncbi:PQ-loop repeat family protein / transmembrane family protein [Zea mays]|uniref:PQ-loop repeat family protein / transmembrane family protein n=1 Tax=Zea mays TaxID=4577 RepID=A0A1D6MQ95_MAIZE|nr:PQ-loop repeat family protein / transmembrane family protein [Zea mays]
MGVLGGAPPASCPATRHCAEWARIYLRYCLCSQKEGAALALGLISVISWGFAEVPQIMTNYRQKSTEGLSVAFLMTWIVGDLFNLVGCFLEPATLPTQMYMALLYTITTLILTVQTIYYSHIYHRLEAKKSRAASKAQKHQRADASLRERLLGAKDGVLSRNNGSDATVLIPSSPIPVNVKLVDQYHGSSPNTDYYYMSPVPTAGTWLGSNRQSLMTPPQTNDQRGSLIGEIAPAHSAPSTVTKNALSVAPWMGLLLGTCLLHILIGNTHREMPSGTVIPVGRRLLVFVEGHGNSSLSHGNGSEIGRYLGWAMAIIYMGGRLPQILLNVRLHKVRTFTFHDFSCRKLLNMRLHNMQRGHAEGLNPLMFTFALLGNSTYVGRSFFSSFISIIGSKGSFQMSTTKQIKPDRNGFFFSTKVWFSYYEHLTEAEMSTSYNWLWVAASFLREEHHSYSGVGTDLERHFTGCCLGRVVLTASSLVERLVHLICLVVSKRLV